MKTMPHSLKLQRGVASLFTAIVLLTCITLVALFTSKTVVMETKMAADDYRTGQATAAATAAMDRAVAYFMAGGLKDKITTATGLAPADSLIDYNMVNDTPPLAPAAGSCAQPAAASAAYAFPVTLTTGSQTTLAQFYFDNRNKAASGANNICNCPAGTCMGTNKRALVVARGWSDDCTAVRTITQCVGTFPIFNKGKGPEQALIAHGTTGASGNITLINRYSNINIWSGGAVDAANAAFGTWVAPPAGVTAFGAGTMSNMLNDSCGSAGCPGGSAILSSNWKGGLGADIIANDATLANLSADEFFAIFFGVNTRADLRAIASSNGTQYASASAVPASARGVIYADAGGTLPGNLGAEDEMVVVIVNGNVTMGSTFYGVIYATGTISTGGGNLLYGSAISETGGYNANGHPQIVYVPTGDDSNNSTPPLGTLGVVAGSWKDW